MKKIASCSFGKDSLAAIIVSEENGIHIDKAVYCRIMFDNSISAEPPEHEAFIHEVAIPTLEKRYGIKTTIVQAKETYLRIPHAARGVVQQQLENETYCRLETTSG